MILEKGQGFGHGSPDGGEGGRSVLFGYANTSRAGWNGRDPTEIKSR
jgi:hypothetical protein